MAHFQMWRDIIIKINGHVVTSYSGGGYPLMLQLLSYAESAEARDMKRSLSFLYPDTANVSYNITKLYVID